MSDLIEREDAIKTVTNLMKNEDDWYREAFKSAIRTIPSARPKGEWLWDDGHFCSNCMKYAVYNASLEEQLTNFCPNCGADMRGVDDGNK